MTENKNDDVLKVEHLVKSFGTHEVLKDLDFSIKPKEIGRAHV